MLLLDIKNKFNIKYNIRTRIQILKDGSSTQVYTLTFGRKLMDEILNTYSGPVPTFYKRK